jgi:hypothetical protein
LGLERFVTVQQLNHIVSQHNKLESQMEDAKAELAAAMAKVNRLRKQKRLWFEKMARAISRGVDTVEELERVEREEAEAIAVRRLRPVSLRPLLLLLILTTISCRFGIPYIPRFRWSLR